MTRVLFALFFVALLPSVSMAQDRIAIIVGANAAAPNRRALRYAHDDARAIASALRDVADFRARDVHLLLEPSPDEVLDAIDTATAHASAGTTLLFYYSGHADAQALYPAGRPLEYSTLRQRLERSHAGVRIGILDACRGGGWTGARGLTETEPFEVELPLDTASEGHVLIASSSGLEDAHESEELHGGFFTHHFTAALRGAADRNGDRAVSVTEAFDYAKRLTIRDTAMRAARAQHPSFSINLRGRNDLLLSRIVADGSLLAIDQRQGPIELVHLDTGLVVLELPAGRRSVQVAVPPGRYVVRTGTGDALRAREITVDANATTFVAEADLALSGDDRLEVRDREPPLLTLSTAPDDRWMGRTAVGISHGGFGAGVRLWNDSNLAMDVTWAYGITDRLQWMVPLPALAYRAGDRGEIEAIGYAGMTSVGFGYSDLSGATFYGSLGLGLDLRLWLSPVQAITVSGGLGANFRWTENDYDCSSDPSVSCVSPLTSSYGPTSPWGFVRVGYTHTLADVATINLGATYGQTLLYRGEIPDGDEQVNGLLRLGSVMEVGLMPQPLIQLHVAERFSIDGYAAIDFSFAGRPVGETYMLGVSVISE